MEQLYSIPVILSLAFAGGLLTFMVHNLLPKLRTLLVLLTVLAPAYLVWQLPADSVWFSFSLGGFELTWGSTAYAHLFSLLIAGLSVLATIYSIGFMKDKSRLGFFYLAFLTSIAAMYGIVFSQDLLSLFFFWEIMTWSSFLMVIYYRFENQKAGIRYFVFSAIGAYALLSAIVYLYSINGDLSLQAVFQTIPSLSTFQFTVVIVLFLMGFGVKSAIMPLHVWAPDAYRSAPSPFTVLFSGVLSKMGIFGMGLVLFKFMGGLEQGHIIREILAWMGGITALLGTFYAIFQTDAKKLLAYSSVAQLGYIIVGLAIGTPMSVMAAIFLALMHAIFKGMLFMGVGSVFHQTGSFDLNELTGLIRRMPLSFVAVLFGIIAVAGVPPLGGFVGKWLLYESLITSNHYFLVTVLFTSSTAAFLYLYRLIFSIFLGQEEPEYATVKEVNWTMWLPMMILAAMTLLTGTRPGIFFAPIAEAMHYLGFQQVNWQMSVLFNPWGDQVNLLAVITSIATVFLLAAVFITWKNYKSTRYVTTKDIHTSGEIPTENENLTYAVDFYRPFERAAEPFFRYQINRVYESLATNTEAVFDLLRHVYTGNAQTYVLYVVMFLVLLIAFSGWIFGIQI